MSMGLSATLTAYMAFRAGRRLRGLSEENFEEKVSDFVVDSLKGLISDALEKLFSQQSIILPHNITIQDVSCHIHLDGENLDVLQNIWNSLETQGVYNEYYLAALDYVNHILSNVPPG